MLLHKSLFFYDYCLEDIFLSKIIFKCIYFAAFYKNKSVSYSKMRHFCLFDFNIYLLILRRLSIY